MKNATRTVIALALLLVFSAVASSTTINIPADQPTIQAGINAASEGDTLLVAPGTYTGEGNHDIKPGSKNLVLKSELGADLTIIDLAGDNSNLNQGFIFFNSIDERTVIDGFTITGGYALEFGGAIYCNGASPTVINCIFSDNFADVRGGAIYCKNNSNPIIENCMFNDNRTDAYGGALYFHFGSDGVVKNCQFIGNSAAHGGAIICDKSTPSFDFCLIAGNTASHWGGGVFIQDNCQSTFTNCTIVYNTAGSGSGMWIQQRYMNLPVSINVQNSIIAYNNRSNPMTIDGADIDVSCTDIFGNEVGDWESPLDVLLPLNGNFSADPLFCRRYPTDFFLGDFSPCTALSPENTCDVLVGAFDVDCASDYLCGDANGDSLVTVADLTLMQSFYFDCGPLPLPLAASDLNCDGSVDIGDIVYLSQFLNGTGPAPCCEK